MTIIDWQPRLDEKLVSWLQIGDHALAREMLPAIWDEAMELCHPETWVCSLKRETFFRRLSLYAGKSMAVCRLLDSTTEVRLFAATIGEELECRVHVLLQQRESFHGYILDRLGSFLIEDIITHLDDFIEQDCKQKGIVTTRRYSPGYRDFSLEAQHLFVELASEDISCLQLNANHILKPEKSITALKGCGPCPTNSDLLANPR